MNGAFLAALIFVFILAGMPIAFSTGLTSVITMAATESLKWASILLREINGIATFTLLAIPLYMLAGKLMNACGVTDRLFGLARALVGWIPGGLGHVNVLASVIFAGMSGSAVADVSGLGIIEIKSMDDAGFDHMDSCCITAASAMIGPIIPPSIVMVVYAISSGASVGALFMAGFLPGLLMGLALMTYIFIRSFRKRYPQDPFPTFRSFFIALKRGILPMMTPVIILAGIYTGIFTATEAAAISVVYTAVLGFFVYHTLTLKTFWVMIRETARETAGIGLLIASAALFGNIIVKSMLPQTIMKFVLTFIHSRISFILLVVLVLLFTGMFMEATTVITIQILCWADLLPLSA